MCMLDGDLLAGVLRLPPAEAAPLLMAAAALLRAGLLGIPPVPQAAAEGAGSVSPGTHGAAQEAWLQQLATVGPMAPGAAAGGAHALSAFAAAFKRAAAGLEQAWRAGSGGGAPAEDTWPMRLRSLVERVLSRFV